MSVKHITVPDAHSTQAEGSTYVDVRSIPDSRAALSKTSREA